MIGIFGLVISLIALMYFAYRGINVLVLAPVCALMAVLFQTHEFTGNGIPLAYYTQVFMSALGKYVVAYFPLFLLGAIFGKLMSDTRAAKVIGETISKKVGSHHAILATVLACALLTYGGVSLFVVAFCVFPISVSLFNEAGIAKKHIPGAIALGSFTFTMTALPGTPAIQNAIPMPFFGTTAFAAPGLGIIAALIMFGVGMVWLNFSSSKTRIAPGTLHEIEDKDQRSAPGFLLAITPLLIVIGMNFLFSQVIIPNWDAYYLKLAAFGGVELKAVLGIWAIIISLVLAILFILLTMRRFNSDMVESLNKGTMGSLLPIFNTASEVGYGAVIASLASFAILKDFVLGISPGNPLISEAIAINTLAGITGSASGGMSIGLAVLGQKYMEIAQTMNINPELLHRIASLSSGGFDTLPHNGAVISLLTICGLTHKESYKDIFMVAVAIPVLATLTVIILGTLFGSF